MSIQQRTAAAFGAVVVLGGLNAVAVRLSNRELAPLWGATLRFGIAAIVLGLIVVATGTALPRGRALTGSVLYGVLGFGAAFGLIYIGLVQVPAGIGQVCLAFVPLLTLLIGAAMGMEGLRLQTVAGLLVAIVGVTIASGAAVSAGPPVGSIGLLIAGGACMAGSNVVAKRFPACHPIANNTVAMTAGALMLLVTSLAAGETIALPTLPQTWAAIAYVAIGGAVGVFTLYLYVIARWPASAASQVMLLMPIVTLAAAAALVGEPITPAAAVGAALVLAGVAFGAFAPAPGRKSAAPARPASVPGCA